MTHRGEKGWWGNLFLILPKQDSSASTLRPPAKAGRVARLKELLFESNGFLHALVTIGTVLLVTRMLTDSQRSDPDQPFALRTAAGFLMFLGPAILLHFFRLPPRKGLINLLALCLPATFVFVVGDWIQNHSAATVSHIGEVPSPLSYYLKLLLVGMLTLSPIALFLLHRKSTLFDRYILHGFTAPFFFCLVAFSSIWLIFDLNDNLPDFRKGNSGLGQILKFYIVQLPFIFTKIAPASLLIAIVYSLSRLSRFNELVSMLSAGQSLGRILAPLFIFSFYISFVFLVFNYQWAPWAEGHKEGLLKQFKKGERGSTSAQRQMYVNSIDRRAWYIGQIPFEVDKEALRIIDIFEHNESHQLVRTFQADSAFWNWKTQQWAFENCTVTSYHPNGDIDSRETLPRHEVDGWLETPWRIVSERLEATYLGVPKLRSYLNSNQHLPTSQLTDHLTFLHHRLASPWSCLVIAFVATPLGIVFSRRGMMGGVALAIFFFAAILFITELFLALGRTGHIAPVLAAWIPNLIFLVIGLGLLFMRTTNRGFDILSKLRKSVN